MLSCRSRLAALVALASLAQLGVEPRADADEADVTVPAIISLPIKMDRGTPMVSGDVLTDHEYFHDTPGLTILRTAEAAAKIYGREGLEQLQKRVDFDKQYLRIFKWRGSGEDRLSYEVSDTQPEEVTFVFERGRTKDFRPHLYVYAIRNDVKVPKQFHVGWHPRTLAFAEELVPAIVELKGVEPLPRAFKPRGFEKPIEIKSAEEATGQLGEEAGAKLAKQVNFEHQFVLVFAWRGSGQDKLEHAVTESWPEQITFTRKPGRTKDLRPHVHVFALRKNVKWSTK